MPRGSRCLHAFVAAVYDRRYTSPQQAAAAGKSGAKKMRDQRSRIFGE